MTIIHFNNNGQMVDQINNIDNKSVLDILSVNLPYGKVTRQSDNVLEFTFNNGDTWIFTW